MKKVWFGSLLWVSCLFGSAKGEQKESILLALRSSSLQVRSQALRYLQKELSEWYLRLSWWPSKGDRKEAERALHSWRDRALVEALFRCLKYPSLRGRALRCLAYLGGREIANRLWRFCRKMPEKDFWRQGFPLFFLLREEGTPYLLSLFPRAKDSQRKILEHAIRFPHPRSLPFLRRLLLLEARYPRLMAQVFRALGKKGEEALASWIEALEPGLALRSILLLGRMKTKGAFFRLLEAYQKAKNPLRRRVLLQAMGETGQGEAFLLKLFQESTSLEVQRLILFGLGFSRGKEGEVFLLKLAERKGKLQADALQALGMRRSQRAFPLFLKLLRSQDAKVQEKALYGLVRLRKTEALPFLEKLFLKSRGKLRWKVFSAISELASLERLDFWQRVLKDFPEESYQQVLVDTLKAFPPKKEVISMMKELGRSPFEEVRHKAWAYLEEFAFSQLLQVLKENAEGENFTVARDSLDQMALYSLPPGLVLAQQGRENLLRMFLDKPTEGRIALIGYFRLKEAEGELKRLVENRSLPLVKRQAALFALASLKTKKGFSLLLRYAKESGELRSFAIQALGKYGEELAKPWLLRYAFSQDSSLRRAAWEGIACRDEPWRRQFFLKVASGSMTLPEAHIVRLFFQRVVQKDRNFLKELLFHPRRSIRRWGVTLLMEVGEEKDFLQFLEVVSRHEELKRRFAFYQKARKYWEKYEKQLLQVLEKPVFSSYVFHLLERRFYLTREVSPFLVKESWKILRNREKWFISWKEFQREFSLPSRRYPSLFQRDAWVLFLRKGRALLLQREKGKWKILGGIW